MKANEAIEELNKMFVTNNYVIRDGQKRKIDVENTNDVVSNIVFGQLLTLTYNMIKFSS